jgi:serine/threonine protein kinase
MSLAVGTKLGPYEILAPLGAGGMGEVFRAHDAKLSRDRSFAVGSSGTPSARAMRFIYSRENRI